MLQFQQLLHEGGAPSVLSLLALWMLMDTLWSQLLGVWVIELALETEADPQMQIRFCFVFEWLTYIKADLHANQAYRCLARSLYGCPCLKGAKESATHFPKLSGATYSLSLAEGPPSMSISNRCNFWYRYFNLPVSSIQIEVFLIFRCPSSCSSQFPGSCIPTQIQMLFSFASFCSPRTKILSEGCLASLIVSSGEEPI